MHKYYLHVSPNEKQKKDWKLDRFAVTAVSILHLAHYRTDVIIHHYFI